MLSWQPRTTQKDKKRAIHAIITAVGARSIVFTNPVQMQIQSLQMLQHEHVAPVNPYYKPPQPEFSAAQHQLQVELAQPQAPPQAGGTSQ
ncbi:hypothetical protein V6N13_073984 [Hibiscus sabdariffa]